MSQIAAPRRWAIVVVLALVAASGISIAHVSRRNSPVYDELAFWGLGYYFVQAGDFNVASAATHPPLGFYLQSLALLPRLIPLETLDPLGARPAKKDLWAADPARGNRLLERFGFGAVVASRIPSIALYLLTGLVLFSWSRRWWGDDGALISLTLYLTCPNLMAHGFLLTSDFLVCSLMVMSLAALDATLHHPSRWRLALFMFLVALVPSAKITGVLVAPLCACLVTWRACRSREHEVVTMRGAVRRVSRRGFLLTWAVIAACCAVLCYGILVALYQGDVALRTLRITVEIVGDHLRRGHRVFLDGEIKPGGFLSYYAYALLYKTPAPVLAVVGLALVLSGVRRGQAMLAVGMAVFVLVSVSFGRYSLGLRFALVVLPLLYLAAGRLLAAATGRNRVLRTVLVGSTVLATLVDLALVYPYPRSYVNRLAVRGEKYEALADSDLDWGEGLVALGDFAARYRLGPLALSYHGAAAPGLFGVTTVWYENAVMGIRAPSFLPPEGLFFVSSTNLSGVYVGRERYAWLRGRAPVAVIGGTIYAFDLKNAPPTP